MNPFLDLELNLILWLRETLPGLVSVFEVLTSLGNETFYLVFLPLVYWCLDRATGARLTILFLTSAATNAGAKALFDQPRPFTYAPTRVEHLFDMPLAEAQERYEATGNGFPSGHTQNTLTIWGYLAAQARRLHLPSFPAAGALVLVVATLMILLVPLSRIYLAVHFPRDLAGATSLAPCSSPSSSGSSPKPPRRLSGSGCPGRWVLPWWCRPWRCSSTRTRPPLPPARR